jgi:exodeoxyribonuclease VII small subunit
VTEKAAKKERFEDHLKQLEEAVRTLESGKLGLEESINRYEQGVKALKHCYAILEQAEKKIQILVKEKDGAAATRDFEPSAGEKPSRKKSGE